MNQKPYQGRPQSGRPQDNDRGPPSGDMTAIRQILASTETVKGGYFGDNKLNLRPELLDRDAQAAAKAMDVIPTTQLRRFFGQVSAIKRRLDMDGGEDIAVGEILAQVAYLKASAAYAAGRDRKNAPILQFLVIHANTIKTRPDFLAFHRHFETVVAFHKVYAIDKKQD
jgi:CRISPR type III-A-associated protein Csm2